MLTIGSLFSGIGGFDLGLERAGMRTVWFCEQSTVQTPFARRILRGRTPGGPPPSAGPCPVARDPSSPLGVAGHWEHHAARGGVVSLSDLTRKERATVGIFAAEDECNEGMMLDDLWPLIQRPRLVVNSLVRKGVVTLGDYIDPEVGYDLVLTDLGHDLVRQTRAQADAMRTGER